VNSIRTKFACARQGPQAVVAKRRKRSDEAGPLGAVVFTRGGDERLIAERGERGGLRRAP
jgi:hypothetical protein